MALTVCRFKGELGKKEEGGVFWSFFFVFNLNRRAVLTVRNSVHDLIQVHQIEHLLTQ